MGAHVCAPAEPNEPFFRDNKVRLEENMQGSCSTRSTLGSRLKFENPAGAPYPFMTWDAVFQASAHFPRIITIAGFVFLDPPPLCSFLLSLSLSLSLCVS